MNRNARAKIAFGVPALLLIACTALASIDEVFRATGTLATERNCHTATRLSDGKVLIAGGADVYDYDLAAAEVYDLYAGKFRPVGSLITERQKHTATLLPNGKVLIAGGFNWASYALGSSELFDAGTGRFTSSGALRAARYDHTATLLPNGKVLIAGGMDDGQNVLDSAELYDPATGTSAYTGALNTARAQATATLLSNGKVLIVGGFDDWGSSLNAAELYDPAAGTFTNTGALTIGRYDHTAALLSNGKVLVAGGWGTENDPSLLSSAELYDPATGRFATTGSLLTARYGHVAVSLGNGKVLVASGYGVASAELYDPGVGTFSATSSLVAVRQLKPTATLLSNGSVLLAGGLDLNGLSGPAELYGPQYVPPGVFRSAGTMRVAREYHTATLLPNGKVLIAGGQNDADDVLKSAELYDPATGTFAWTGSMRTDRDPAATLLPNGKVLVTGGLWAEGELYDPATGTFALTTGDMTVTRWHSHTSTLLGDGTVLVAGGFHEAYMRDADVYDPATGRFTETGGLITGRAGHTALRLGDGKAIIVGGGWTPIELYDPAGRRFNATSASINASRWFATAALLPNGDVLIAGGDTSDVYHSASGTLTAGDRLGVPRHSEFTLTRLSDGRILMAGGSSNPACETYDSATGQFRLTASLLQARGGHSATLLPDGKVLVCGGFVVNSAYERGATRDSCELYDPTASNSPPPPAPATVAAIATSTTTVAVSWAAVTGAATYQIARSADGVNYSTVGTTAALAYTDSASANTSYLYKVRALDASGTAGAYSAADLATTTIFTDDPIAVEQTVVKVAHLSELRAAVNSVRRLASLPDATFTDTLAAGVTPVRAIHIHELRSSLAAARTSLALPPAFFTDADVAAKPIETIHLTELRDAVK